jgi:hypothetical protein
MVLTSCGGAPSETRDNSGQREAEGEVLGGTISDEMIPLERLRSQSRNLRAAPQTEQESQQEVGELFDEIVAGTDSGAGSDALPIAPAQPPAPEPAQAAEPAN